MRSPTQFIGQHIRPVTPPSGLARNSPISGATRAPLSLCVAKPSWIGIRAQLRPVAAATSALRACAGMPESASRWPSARALRPNARFSSASASAAATLCVARE